MAVGVAAGAADAVPAGSGIPFPAGPAPPRAGTSAAGQGRGPQA
ncbi:MAG: hypothetical protein AVDCRST_MAG83-766 [uncultured Arthrobacter sp.]|uniref:Uncharacterized protein n=1 Tax=uncultured Arthrobacter sp. TaxID=114050 RepID=A0A6J4HIG1_9MICC|nr:MAG: hypothetical protein AVDCRST_MAG83-766 [uncultured Arthrobacter sp.]